MENMSLSDIAAATGGGMGGNSWIVLLILFAMIYGNGGGLFGGGNSATDSINRAVDMDSIKSGQSGIAQDVQRAIYEINTATKDAAYNNLGEIRDIQQTINNGFARQSECCCELKTTMLENRYLASQESNANTQKILDTLSTNRMADMQNQINQLQLSLAMSGTVKYPMQTTYSSGSNPFCAGQIGCGC